VQLGAQLVCCVGALVQGIAQESALGVDPSGWSGPGDPMDHGEVPDAEVDQGVVPAADKGKVVDVGSA
jgi:hypothetical protein